MSKFTVILDACELYPAPLRDALMRLAMTDLFKARWTDDIHQEWISALLRSGKHTRTLLENVKTLMDTHVRDAKVSGYQALIGTLDLPDPNDRHVLAAAIRCNADAIVSFNLKDFPKDALNPYGIEVIHPDDFIVYQIDMAPETCCRAIQDQRKALKNPEMDVQTFLATLARQQLQQTVSRLKDYADLL